MKRSTPRISHLHAPAPRPTFYAALLAALFLSTVFLMALGLMRVLSSGF